MMKIIAHRGASGYAPENTAAALKLALEQGADLIEVDVHTLPTGEVVLMHDHRVNRTTDGLGYVLDHSLPSLRKLNAGSGEAVPTLEEAIDIINHRVPLNIELKGPGSAASVARIVKKRLGSGWQPSDFLASSFNHHEIMDFKRLVPEIDTVAMNDAIPLHYAAFAAPLQVVGIGPSDEFVDKAYVDDAHHRGLTVFVWTVNDPEEIGRMCALGVDGIFTDYPDRARQVAESFRAFAGPRALVQ